MIARLRLWSGLFLLVFVVSHLINHILGIVSLATMAVSYTHLTLPTIYSV